MFVQYILRLYEGLSDEEKRVPEYISTKGGRYMKMKFNRDRFQAELKKPLNQMMLVCFVIYLSIFITNQFAAAGDIINFVGMVAFIGYLICLCISYERMSKERDARKFK